MNDLFCERFDGVLVSIIMPCFNAERTIKASIESVIAQSYSNWELLVIDDCSSDETKSIVESYVRSDSRIKFFCLSSNSGSPARPRNLGLDNATGAFIAFLDSDDIWFPSKLFEQVSFMVSNRISFSCTAYQIADGTTSNVYRPPYFADYKNLLSNNSIGCLTCMVSRELIGHRRFPAVGHEDFALWLQLLKHTDGVYALDKVLATYNKIEGSVSSNKAKLIRFYWNLYRKQEGFNVFKSFYFCLRYFVNVVWFKYR